ncbi:MAG: PD40 domain-containing protein [Lewinellaceae bacterium]|nr:PD40 domain-containing protein [Saprospiraceae bacterium]MCB9337027.1 PD40 domain-containing protein [Lewinellaceae bacterium]
MTSLFLLAMWVVPANAQYFGRNKPKYENHDFKVVQTPHFEIYQYLDNPELLETLANQAEHWYLLHQAVLADTFTSKNPLLIYNDHPDFQQTNAVGGEIGVGTGGVTEGLKNRVILPVAMSNAQTKHVLGHELVHAFQYHMIIDGDSTSIRNLGNLPLWMIEGLAEYMSIGRVDANTSLWMRDAVLNDKVPRIRDLYNPEFFPYRWGQAFWAFIAGWKGDGVIRPFFVSTAKYGFDKACKDVLGVTEKELSKLWVDAIKGYYGPYLGDKKERFIGRPFVTDEKGGGRLNIAPVLSPNGQYVLFLSEKDLFSIDVFLADAVNGDIIRKVHSGTKGGHLDDLSFIESAGTWSPDSKEFAFVAVKDGSNVLVIKDLKGKTKETFGLEGVPAFSNPAWSPDGKSIVVAGLVNGQVDLFQVTLKNKKVERLTNDKYSEMEPSWSPDGSQLVYATDKLSFEKNAGEWTFNLAIMDMGTHQVQDLDFFYGADNLNPLFDAQGNIIFLSDRDGFRNMYSYEPATGKIFQMTDFLTGISGITPYAPAISVSVKENRDRLFFTHYFNGRHNIYKAKSEDFLHREVAPDSVDLTAATLPRINKQAPNVVDVNLSNMDKLENMPATGLKKVPYKPKFKLDYIGGGGGIGIGTGGMFGGATTGLSGGVDMVFGDMLGDHQLYTSLFLNGEIYDFGGAVAYLNRKHRINWGVGLSHMPLQSGRFSPVFLDTLQLNNGETVDVYHSVTDIIRIFQEKVDVFAQYPFSKNLRVEAGASLSYYSNRVDRYDQYYSLNGSYIGQDKTRLDPDEAGLNLFKGTLASVNAGLVGDNSYFGIASPVKGYRFRVSGERYFGDFDFYNLTLDGRKYFFAKPFTLAARAMHYGRYGRDANSFYPLYLGYPWYVRGYEFGNASEILQQNKRSLNELFGSKIAVSNVELRVPFTGPEQLALIKSKFFLTELSVFLDGGLAWDTFDKNADSSLRQFDLNPLFSAGVSMRINLFGALVLEPYYAWPLLKDTKGTFGLNIVPGW